MLREWPMWSMQASFDGADAAALRLQQDPSSSSAKVFVEEETCADTELFHTTESVAFLAIAPQASSPACPR